MDLSSPISDLPKVGPILAGKFEKIGVATLRDLFYHVPSRYLDYSQIISIGDIRPGETVTIHAKVISIKNIYSKRGLKMQIGSVEDAADPPGGKRKLQVLWFNQPFLVKMLYPGRSISLSGKVGFFNRKICLTSPDYELIDDDAEGLHTGRLVPVYPETSGLSSKWIRRKMKDAFQLTEIKDFLSETVLHKSALIGRKEAIEKVHFPKNMEATEKGRKRLAFDEIFSLELKSILRKNAWQKNKPTYKLDINKSEIKKFIDGLPFELTHSQKKACDEILDDMKGKIPMNRLLEGDVGSGKTVVAAIAAFAAFTNGLQTVIMAPTQILAEQHYKTLNSIFGKYKVRISLITASSKKIEVGRTDIFIGTHALIHQNIDFGSVGDAAKVALVVIDEQHRFGVEQRTHLINKSGKNNVVPHVLTMTATPIPRTIALTTYGDLDLSVLSEVPKNRQKITTWVVPEQKRAGAYKWIKSQILNFKSQIFVVCPLIEDSETETLADIKSVTSEFEKLKKIFAGKKLGLLHGRLKTKEKNTVLDDFRKGKIDILVATPVIEVGIDIPKATIMVIEAAERFGLAQLHQLRGRVGRGDQKSYCLLFSNFHTGKAYSRLKAMETSHSGFELAELDLKMRGPGEVFGTAQSGFPELKIASWNNYELIKEAREVAEKIAGDPKQLESVSKLLIENRAILG